ncbi:MAG: acyl-CoA thioesterase [Actinobacteria bacterium]|nr:acyl-CoA thioesterase [Actinomycetota bacterium]
MKHHRILQVRWDDLDAFNHVNNAAYLTFIQEARSDFLWFSRKRAGLKPILEDMVVARAEVDFIAPIYNGGTEVEVEISVARLGTASFDLDYAISGDGVLYATGRTVQVAVSMDTKRSRPLSDEERTFLTQYLNELDNR